MIEIRRATLSDIDAISALASSLEIDLKGVLSTEQIDYLHDLSYVQGNIKNQFDEGQLFFVAAANGKDVGFATLFAEGPDLFHLCKIFVHRDMQRQGVGSALITYIQRWIKEQHPEPCTMELAVNRFNTALPFYEKMGMRKVREQLSDMGNGFILSQDVMALNL